MAWTTEAELVRSFVALVDAMLKNPWTVYAETAGWDLLLQHRDGFQLGIEAKLSLNAKVVEQALSGTTSFYDSTGPDYRAVLVPESKLQKHLVTICRALGIGIIALREKHNSLRLPEQTWCWNDWPNWCPLERCKLPDYVPDVCGGHSAPLKLTEWKIKAIRLCILLERRGFVTRADFKDLQISPTRWTDAYYGFLVRAPERGGFIAGPCTPDFRTEHPTNFAEVEADFDRWGAKLLNARFDPKLPLAGAA